MPSRIFIVFCCCWLSVCRDLAAAVLKGLIIANEIGGPPMTNVQVAADGASSVVSNSLGIFALEFPHKEPGSTVHLVVNREGYEVVNEVQLELTVPDPAEAKVLIVLLCKQGSREEMAKRFYRLKSFEATEATYKAALKELQESRRATAAALTQLERQRFEAHTAAEKTAHDFAKIRPGERSELYKQAMRLFLDGKAGQALKLLDDEKLRRLMAEARNKKVEAEEAIQVWLLKARLMTVQFRFAEAEKAYQEAIDAAPDNWQANFVFAEFSQDLNRYEKALPLYLHCLELSRQSGDKAQAASALHNLGVLHKAQNRMEEARQAYEEALNIRRQLAQHNPETYLPEVATTLHNLGVLHSDQNRMEEERKAYEEALKIRRQLARNNPETYLPEVANTLHNLGVLHSGQNRMEEARQAYDEALKCYRELARNNPGAYLPYVAGTLHNLGVLHSDHNRMEEARHAYEEALGIRRQLAQNNPETYLPYVAAALNNLGFHHRAQNRMEEARQACEEALKCYRELAQSNPETYLPYVAATLNNLGILHSEQNRAEQARIAYGEALRIRRQLAQTDPETYLPDVAVTLSSLGNLQWSQRRMEEARKAYEEALRIFEQFAISDPRQFSPRVSAVRKRLNEINR
jgi:tetratricopeptide (TPR) repeat protein